MPIIKIHREVGYADRLRAYRIDINSSKVATIKAGATTEHSVSEGKHVIQLKIDWACSNELEIDATSKQTIELVCGNSMKGWHLLLSLFYISIWREKYLWIKEAST
jgi:hypothetical protein